MPRPYPLELRRRVLAAARQDRHTHAALAARFGIASSTVRGWIRQERLTGTVAPKPHAGGSRSKVDRRGEAVLRALVAEPRERTLAELAEAYRQRTGQEMSVSGIWRACERLGLRRRRGGRRTRRRRRR